MLHISPSFKEQVFKQVQELSVIYTLFEKAQHGIAFYGKTKKIVGEQIKKLHLLGTFDQFIAVIQILKTLASSEEIELLHQTTSI